MRDPLRERISRYQQQAGDAVEKTGSWELKQYTQACERLDPGECQCLEGRHGATSDRTKSCSADVWVEVAIPEIIDSAAGAAHDESPAKEKEGCHDDRRERRIAV